MSQKVGGHNLRSPIASAAYVTKLMLLQSVNIQIYCKMFTLFLVAKNSFPSFIIVDLQS